MTSVLHKPPGTKTQSERRAAAREAMLDAAIELWAEKGPDAFTMAEVGERAGYSRGEPAHYFSTKAGVVRAVVEELFRRFDEKPTSPQVWGLAPLFAYLDQIVVRLEAIPNDRRAFHILFGYAHRDPDILRRLQVLNGHLVDHFDRHLTAALKAGDLDGVVHTRTQAILILLSLRGLATSWMVEPEGLNSQVLSAHFLRTLRNGLSQTTA